MILAEVDLNKFLTDFWATMVYDIAGFGLADEVSKMSTGAISYTNALPIIESVGETIKMVASVLLMVHFLCYILDQATKDALSMDTFFKGFVKFIIGFFFVNNCTQLFNYLVQLGDAMMSNVGDDVVKFDLEDVEGAMTDVTFFTFPSGKDWMETLVGVFNDFLPKFFVGLVNIFIGMGTTLLFYLINLIVLAVAGITLVTRVLELAVRALFGPIAVVDVFEHGTSGSGFKYIKKFFATALQGTVIMALIMLIGGLSLADISYCTEHTHVLDAEGYACQFVNNTVMSVENIDHFGTVMSFYLKNTVLKIAGIGLMLKSQPICNDIVGV